MIFNEYLLEYPRRFHVTDSRCNNVDFTCCWSDNWRSKRNNFSLNISCVAMYTTKEKLSKIFCCHSHTAKSYVISLEINFEECFF